MAPRRKSNASKWTTGKVFLVGVGLMFVALFIFGGPLQALYDAYGPDWMRTNTGDPDAKPVDLSIGIWLQLSDGVPTTTCPVDIYDVNMVKIETRNSDTTTGIVNFQSDYWEGETVFVQAYRLGNTATGLNYPSPVMQFVIPDADVNGDSQLPTIVLYPPSGSSAAVTITATKQDGVGLSGTAINYLNETDTAINILINTVTADTAFGLPTQVYDPNTGFTWLAGCFIRIVTNATLPFADPDYYWAEGTTFYYVWNVAMIQNDAGNPSDGTYNLMLPAQVDFTVTQTSSTNVTITIDAFDWVRLNGFNTLDGTSFFDFDTSNSVAVINTRLVPA
jgi:hypothetical protein